MRKTYVIETSAGITFTPLVTPAELANLVGSQKVTVSEVNIFEVGEDETIVAVRATADGVRTTADGG